MSPFIPGMSGVWVLPIVTIASLTPLPSGEKMAYPHARHGFRWAKRKGGSFGNLHKCSSHHKFVSGDLGTWVPTVSVNGQPVPFPAPLQDHDSRHRWVGHAHLEEMSVSKAHKLLQRENLSHGILWPVPLWGAPISTPRVSLPIISSGNSCLDSNMAVLSP